MIYLYDLGIIVNTQKPCTWRNLILFLYQAGLPRAHYSVAVVKGTEPCSG